VNVRIRRAAERDREAVFALLRELASDIYGLPEEEAFRLYDELYGVTQDYERALRGLSEGYRVYVLEVGGEVAGLVSVMECGRCLYIDDLVVRRGLRGRGYGRALVEHLERAYGGYECLVVDAHEGAVGFFRRLGFAEVLRRRGEVVWVRMVKRRGARAAAPLTGGRRTRRTPRVSGRRATRSPRR